MDKLKMHSPNLVEQNIDKLAALFPNCVTESKDENGKLRQAIDFDLLKQELSRHIVDGPQERYQLNWPGKREALLTANAPIAKTLRPCREESVNFDTTRNLFIEGDNLDALKLLQETYLGKIRVIYIDPPYNTGNDFIYEDDFSETTDEFMKKSNQKDEAGNLLVTNKESDGRFHSNWLSMIYSRLRLARNLLSDDGVIFISIDDNEVASLRKICDEIFGFENQINPIVHNKLNAKNDTINIQRNHEYILCYRKSVPFLTNTKIAPSLEKKETITEEVLQEGDRFYLVKDSITTRGDGGTLNERKNLGYSIYFNPKTKDFLAEQDYDINLAQTSNIESEIYKDNQTLLNQGYVVIRPPKVRGRLGAWTWDINKFNSCKDEIVIHETRNGYSVKKRVFVDAAQVFQRENKHYIRHSRVSNSRSIIEYSTNEGSTQLAQLMNADGIFSNPKNVKLLEYLLSLIPSRNYIFLDFFAGSGSSINALLNINHYDEGNRRFIAVQLPESCEKDSAAFKAGYSTISDICKERIRRVGNKLSDDHLKQDTGFRVLKIDTSNMSDIYYSPDAVTQDDLFDQVENVKSDRSEEDLLFQVMLDWGVDLTLPIRRETIADKKVFFVDAQPDNSHGALVACFDKTGGIDEDFIKQLAAFSPLRLVFRDAGFASDAAKTNAEQLLKQLSATTDVKTI